VTTVASWPFAPESTFVDQLDGLYVPWNADAAPDPTLIFLNAPLAEELGFDAADLRSDAGVAMLSGNAVPDGTTPVAQAYAGHQFGGYSPRLGDGRALLLGEVVDAHGRRRDLHMKGSGRTPFSRGGDGKAAVGPMLREVIIGEAMYGLGIPTTRALAVVATGEPVARDEILPGAILTRVAASHLRVGTFQFAAATGDRGLLQRLLDHAIARHHPEAAEAANPALGLLDAVVGVQASLIAQWMLVGFVHGVMNTDNTTISGETIDYGPCAFIDAYDPDAVFSSIDHGGRYAYGNQPAIMMWNLARLAETLLPLIDEDSEAAVAAATEVLNSFPERLAAVHEPGMRAKLGLDPAAEEPGDAELAADLLALMHRHRVDHTSAFRALSDAARGQDGRFRQSFAADSEAALDIDAWLSRWVARIGDDRTAVAAAMDAVNPVYIARNHLVEEALAAVYQNDLGPFEQLLEVLAAPYAERAGLERYAEPAPSEFGETFQTFCGT